jgi:hypothetical protein
MTQFKVAAPEAGFSGAVGHIQFANGTAVIDDEANPAELAYCRSAGYAVEEADAPKGEPADMPETKSAPARRAPVKKESDK